MHIGRVHDKTIITRSGPTGPRKPKVVAHASAIDGEPGKALAVMEPVQLPTTRRTVRMQRETRETLEIVDTQLFALNFCPNCQFPVKIVDNALAKQQIDPAPYCPNCTFPMNVIRTSVRVANKQHAHV